MIATETCVVVDFTSDQCPPCRVISPELDKIAHEYEHLGWKAKWGPRPKLVAIKVPVNTAKEISLHHGITATPTFKFYLRGSEVGSVSLYLPT